MASLKMLFSSHPTRLLRLVCETASNIIYDYRCDANVQLRVAPCFRLLAAWHGLSRSLASHGAWFEVSAQRMPGRFIRGGEDVEHNDEWEGIVSRRKKRCPGSVGRTRGGWGEGLWAEQTFSAEPVTGLSGGSACAFPAARHALRQ